MTRIKELAVMVLIGDAVLGIAQPRRHVARWKVGPWAPAMAWAAERPLLTRVVAGVELAAGLRYASRLAVRERGE